MVALPSQLLGPQQSERKSRDRFPKQAQNAERSKQAKERGARAVPMSQSLNQAEEIRKKEKHEDDLQQEDSV